MAAEIASKTAADLAQRYDIDHASATTLARYDFEPDVFDQLQARVLNGASPDARLDANRIRSTNVEALSVKELTELPKVGMAEHTDLAIEGMAAISAGEVAVLVLAGGMATRFGGGVKALAEVLDGLTFVDAKLTDLRLMTNRQIGQSSQTNLVSSAGNARIPMWLMTSFLSDAALRNWARDPDAANLTAPISFAPQSVSMRLRLDGELFRTEQGQPSLYAPGHGEVSQALQRSGLLADYIANGGKHVYISNVDNIAATLDPAIIGAHRRAGTPITCEITTGLEVGGSPWLVDGRSQIVESWRLPPYINPASASLVNTNSLVVDAETLATDQPFTWLEVRKEVAGTVVVQFERLIGELTAFVDATMLLVERDGESGRFQPVKDANELQQRRLQIEQILTARGIISA